MRLKKIFIKRTLLLLLLVSFVYIVATYVLISEVAQSDPVQEADYLIILGARLHGERMSLSLSNRVMTALKYLEENPNTIIIASGGQGPGEDITEADAIERYLIEHGIDKNRIIKESASTSTYENLLNSYSFIEEGAHVVIVSNDFHLFRAKMIASRVGYRDVSTLAAETPKVAKTKLWLREYVAILKSLVVDW